MVLSNKKIITIISFITFLSFSCNRKTDLIFIDLSGSYTPTYTLPNIPIDQSILADLTTKLLIDAPSYAITSPLTPVLDNRIAVHPQKGPFLFANAALFTIVASDSFQINLWLDHLADVIASKQVLFVPLLNATNNQSITISKNIQQIQSNKKTSLQSIALKNGVFKLTPQNMAAALSQFDQWEGIQIDEHTGELIFYGSDKTKNPQISASDLITAYNAIFVHEAGGESLFVDMDFAGNDEDYLVTFGGGFEDTRMGRVLLSADLMLKALSSGIDPWTEVKPLVEQMCAVRNKTPFQKAFCDHLHPFILQEVETIEEELDIFFNKYLDSQDDVTLVTDLVRNGENSAIGPWEYVFFASPKQREIILNEISEKGYFNYIKNFSLKEILDSFKDFSETRDLTNEEVERLARIYYKEQFQNYENTSCACVIKIFSQELTNCSIDCDKELTYSAVKRILDLTEQQKILIQEAKELDSEEKRILYSTLSFISPKIHQFLQNTSKKKLDKIFDILFRLEEQFYKTDESLFANLALLHFISKDADFLNLLLELDNEDQIILGFISAQMMLNPDFSKMVSQLQFYHPLCNNSYNESTRITSSEDAFRRFVCKHLSKFPRTYLTDLIRAEVKDVFEYSPSHEIIDSDLTDSLGEGVHTTRYWFFPANEVLYLSEDLNTFVFNRPIMEAKAERIDSRRGPFEVVNYQEERIPGVHENLDLINKNYESLAEVFPTLKELNNVVRLLAFFRWIRDFHPEKFDMDAFTNAVDFGTPTPRTYPIFETVIALPGGGLLRSVGGVDLHSNTQVSINQEKIDQFLTATYKQDNTNVFPFNGHQYSRSEPIQWQSQIEEVAKTLYTNSSHSIYLEETGGYSNFYFSTAKQLLHKWSKEIDIYESILSGITNYQDSNNFKSVYAAGGTLLQQWKIIPTENAISIQLISQKDELSYLDYQKGKLAYLNTLDLPIEDFWKISSVDFEHAKLFKSENTIIFVFETNGESYHFKIQEDIQVISKDEFEQIEKKAVQINQAIGLKLSATVPTDSIFVNELGFKDDSILRVNIYGKNKQDELNMFEWRDILGGEKSFPIPTRNVNVVSPISNEYKKGKYQSFELTNRPFLIESITGLRNSFSSKRFILSRESNFQYDSNELEQLWSSPKNRVFVVDSKGFTNMDLQKLRKLAAQNPNKLYIVDDANSLQTNLDIANDSELIWITALDQIDIQKRLESKSAKMFLSKTERLRVMNIHNSVYDLGENIFVLYPNLKIVGASPIIIDFETFYPVIENLLQTEIIQELDTQLMTTINEIKKQNRQNLTPLKLRINRYLTDIPVVWEEITISSNWKKYNLNDND